MTDRYYLEWATERGHFRFWDNGPKYGMVEIARELMSMGAIGVRVTNMKRDAITFQRGNTADFD